MDVQNTLKSSVTVQMLNSSYRFEIEKLRQCALEVAYGFHADLQALKWSSADEEGWVLGVLNEEKELLSTLRVEVVHSPDSLRSRLDLDGFESQVSLPCGVIGKAATRADMRGRGYNSLLIREGVKLLQNQGIKQVVGTLIEGSARRGILIELGFKFIPHLKGWSRFGCFERAELKVELYYSLMEP